MTVLLTECWSKVLRPTEGSLLMMSQPDLMQEQDVVCLRELFVEDCFSIDTNTRSFQRKLQFLQ
jgi:hypothetical protein